MADLSQKFFNPAKAAQGFDLIDCPDAPKIDVGQWKNFLGSARLKVDHFYASNPHILQNLAPEYPIGCCAYITPRICEIIENSPEICDQIKSQYFHRVYIILNEGEKDSYFQHGLQIGNYFVNAAADAAESPNKVEITPIKKLDFCNIHDFDQALAIAEKYWDFTFYPNLYFPKVAPALPFFGVGKGEIRPKFFSDFLPLFLHDAANGFRGAESYIFSKLSSAPVLSPQTIEQMQQAGEKMLGTPFCPAEIGREQIAKIFVQIRNAQPSRQISNYLQYWRNFFNFPLIFEAQLPK